MSNSTHPSNLDNIKELLDQLDQEYNATYRSPDAIAALVKTIKSFNITITDWNTLVDYISVLGSSMRALVKTVPEIAGLIAPMYGYVDLESDQDVRGLKDFKDGIKIGTAPTNDADATTKLYVDTNVQNVREVAEGKCKTLVLDYATTIGESSFGNTNIIVKKETGEVLESYQDFLNYIGNRSLGNALLNSVEQSVSADMSKYYFVEQELDNHIYTIYTELSAYNTGDILLIIETSVPDRWLRFIRLPQININKVVLYKLEISKLDIQNVPDHVYITTSNRPSGLDYGLRIQNNGWTSDIQQEGGAKIELTGTAVKMGNIEINGETIKSSTDNGEDWNITNTNGTLYYERTNLSYSLAIGGTSVWAVNIFPKSNNSYSLGSGSVRWYAAYLNNQLNFGDGLYIAKDDSDRIGIYHNNVERIKIGGETSTYCAADWTPDQDNKYLLGTGTLRWKAINVASVLNAYSNLTLKGNPNISVALGNNASEGALIPSVNNKNNLGNAVRLWKDLYLAGKIYLDESGNYTISKDVNTIRIDANGNAIGVKGPLRPTATSSYDLGTSTLAWKDLYLAGAIKGVATMTQAQYDALATKDADTLYFIEEE